MNLNELFWKKMRYILLFTFVLSIGFIVLTKFIFQVPVFESQELLDDIGNSEKIIEEQEKYIQRVKDLREDIDTIQFDIYQVQKLDELKKQIYSLQDIYKKNSMNNKYIFGIQSSKILKLYFDSREELQTLRKNNDILEQNLNECKANI